MPAESDLLPDLSPSPSALALRDRLTGWAESLDLSLSRLVVGAVVTIVLGIAAWRLLAPSPAPPEMGLPMVSGGNEVAAASVTDAPDTGGEETSEPAGTAAPGASIPTSPDTPAGDGEAMVVHVAGAVHEPGVQQMSASARIVDAVEASGGATPDADLARINLAAELQDGQQIYVPAVGEDPPQPVGGAESSGGTAGTSSPGASAGVDSGSGLVNVNTAGLEELETLPGIGPAIGQAVLDHRELQGPFSSIDQLTDVRGIGEAKLEGLRDLATV
jgi:competence protein ComEA